MATWHQLSDPAALPAVKACWQPGDHLLLMGEATLLGVRDPDLPMPCLGLMTAIQARGLVLHWPDRYPAISAAEWVEQVTRFDRCVSWS